MQKFGLIVDESEVVSGDWVMGSRRWVSLLQSGCRGLGGWREALRCAYMM